MNTLESQLLYPWADALPAPGTALEVAPGVRWLRMGLPFALDHINLWLLRDRQPGPGGMVEGWTVVDCCVATEAARAQWEAIFATQLEGLPDRVPSPHACLQKAQNAGMVDEIVRIAGVSLNMALVAAANETQPANRVFSPQNWIKAKTCLAGINFAINNYFAMLPHMPGGKEMKERLEAALMLKPEDFEYRWAAD